MEITTASILAYFSVIFATRLRIKGNFTHKTPTVVHISKWAGGLRGTGKASTRIVKSSRSRVKHWLYTHLLRGKMYIFYGFFEQSEKKKKWFRNFMFPVQVPSIVAMLSSLQGRRNRKSYFIGQSGLESVKRNWQPKTAQRIVNWNQRDKLVQKQRLIGNISVPDK